VWSLEDIPLATSISSSLFAGACNGIMGKTLLGFRVQGA
jgi:hypothetical protein